MIYYIMSKTTITDDNIRKFVDNINDKSSLPDDLQEIPIGKWDVSQVTNMENLFTPLKI